MPHIAAMPPHRFRPYLGSYLMPSLEHATVADAMQPGILAGAQGVRAIAADGPLVLIAYASRYGSTQGVAERIAAHLGELGVRTELRPANEAVDVSCYDAVILGSPVFNQRWLPEAERLAQRSRVELRSRPTWLFSIGSFGDRKRLIGRIVQREPKYIGELEQAIRPRDYRVFAGIIDPHRWPLPSRLFYLALGGRFGDNRDWPEIEAWAAGIARALRTDSDDSGRSAPDGRRTWRESG